MVAGCGANCMKYVLFIFNILFFLLGLCLVAVGAYLLFMSEAIVGMIGTEGNAQAANGKQFLTILAVIFLVAGFFLMAICFFGCCGAIKEIKCLLGTYAILLLLVIIGELVIIVKTVMFKDQLFSVGELKTVILAESIRSYKGDEQELIDRLQKNSKCCGDESWEDFQKYAKDWNRRDTYQVPLSCCILKDEDGEIEYTNLVSKTCPINPTSSNSYIDRPCRRSLEGSAYVKKIFTILIASACGLFALELIGIIFAICLIRMIGESRSVPV